MSQSIANDSCQAQNNSSLIQIDDEKELNYTLKLINNKLNNLTTWVCAF